MLGAPHIDLPHNFGLTDRPASVPSRAHNWMLSVTGGKEVS